MFSNMGTSLISLAHGRRIRRGKHFELSSKRLLTLRRAFVAASRRKDRSLDSRLESAIRASILHKQRTGKTLRVTKEIVEKDDMYEEVDEQY